MPQARLWSLLAPLAMLGSAAPIAAQGATCLYGRVFSAPNVPVAGARVTVTFTAFTTTTDDSGRYTLGAVPAGTASVRVTAVGHTSSQVDGLQLPARGAVRQDFVLEPSAPNRTQAPPSGATGASRSDSAAPRRAPARTCPTPLPAEYGEGSYVDKLPVDQVSRVLQTATNQPKNGPPQGERIYVDGVPVQSRGAAVDSTTGRITGLIRDETGRRLVGVQVTIVGTPLKAITDSLGLFTLTSVPPGVIAVRVTHPQFRDAVIEGLRIRGGQRIQQDVVLAGTP
jgi:hypothetical protein